MKKLMAILMALSILGAFVAGCAPAEEGSGTTGETGTTAGAGTAGTEGGTTTGQ
ncbi:MAG: hypothetical protein KIT11_10755 [Fimbriimonadaceae bacterium]|nr:hypothetical protein [Fimbriimonadaceae bacterium]QYK55800.1 MAG: hypothetical protein KF733_12425 [Fimbriimonadaceae bacterium]